MAVAWAALVAYAGKVVWVDIQDKIKSLFGISLPALPVDSASPAGISLGTSVVQSDTVAIPSQQATVSPSGVQAAVSPDNTSTS